MRCRLAARHHRGEDNCTSYIEACRLQKSGGCRQGRSSSQDVVDQQHRFCGFTMSATKPKLFSSSLPTGLNSSSMVCSRGEDMPTSFQQRWIIGDTPRQCRDRKSTRLNSSHV